MSSMDVQIAESCIYNDKICGSVNLAVNIDKFYRWTKMTRNVNENLNFFTLIISLYCLK